MNAKHRLKLLALVIGLATCNPTQAGGGFIGATEPTQILNNIELVGIQGSEIQQIAQQATQIANQVTMISNMIQRYQNMLQNTLNIPNQVWGNILQALTPLTNIVRQGQAIAYSMANLDVRFRQRFPDYGNFLNTNFGAPQMYGSYQGWYTTQRDGIDGALLAANLQSSQFANENATMATLTAMGDNASGRMQALQVGNQIANQQVQQMQKLRQLVMAQMQMQANYMAAEAAKDAAKNAQAEKFWQAPRNTVVGDEPRYTRP